MTAKEPMFPILHDPIIHAIPWSALAQHEAQAQANHGQSLKRLADRGGLSICEAYYILKDARYPFSSMPDLQKVRIALMQLIYGMEDTQK